MEFDDEDTISDDNLQSLDKDEKLMVDLNNLLDNSSKKDLNSHSQE